MYNFENFACVDWSGAVGEHHAGIRIAICASGNAAPMLVRPDHRWSRAEIVTWLQHEMPSRTLIGMDLSTSMPFIDCGAYFPGWDQSPEDAPSLWSLVDNICKGDAHFEASSFIRHAQASRHFRQRGGLVGDLFEAGRGRLRETERAQAKMGLNPYSNFNLIGAAQVGKSSLTGMRVLHRLRGTLPVWPIDGDAISANGSLLIEIYTTLAAMTAGRRPGRSKMRNFAELQQALNTPAIFSQPIFGSGNIDDHSSDAILTAAWMRRAAENQALWLPENMTNEITRKEGWTFGVI